MNYQTLITTVALIPLPFAFPFASAEPKAYEIVNYKGKGAGVTVAFEFADGYPNYSEVKVTESASGKTMKFLLPDGDDQMGTGKMRFVRFVRGKGYDGTKEVLLEMEGWDNPRFTLAKSE